MKKFQNKSVKQLIKGTSFTVESSRSKDDDELLERLNGMLHVNKGNGYVEYPTGRLDAVDTRASRGYVKDYEKNTKNKPNANPSAVNIIRDMFRNDTVLSTALDTTVDVVTFNGYDFSGKNKTEIENARDKFDNLMYSEVIDNIYYQWLMYGDAFLELRRDGSDRVEELWPLETTEMSIKYDNHGKIELYKQISGSDEVTFDTKDIIQFRLKWIGSQVYSWTPFESAARAFSTNMYASNYLNAIFRNLPPKLIYILNNADKTAVDLFMNNLRRCKTNPELDLVITGDKSDVKNTVPDLPSVLMQILNFVRQQMLMVTRVPPIMVGLPEDSNRSNSNAQILSFQTRIKKLQQKESSNINYNPTTNLMKELGFGKFTKFIRSPVSLEDENLITQIAERMKNIGYGPEVVDDYLRNKGFRLMPNKIPNFLQQQSIVGKSEDMFPSRKRNNEGEARKDNLNQKGVSDEGKNKSEEQSKNRNLTS